jgi:hypothetical protein
LLEKVSTLETAQAASATDDSKKGLASQDEVSSLKALLAASDAKASSLQQVNTRLLQKVKDTNSRVAQLEDGVGNTENKNNSSSSSGVSLKKQTVV